jgi:guanylate cyclase soluble subunit beta
MIPLIGDEGNIIFMNSPNLVSLEDLLEKDVYVSDIPFFDATRDLIVLNQHRLTEIQIR